ncbi:hypothetical protein CONCODRAFT_78245 [Conidiobolus coronatus NRRL 28638]|uniref:Sequence orphan n=1 Tax=Conidiobolus coronatus (strain ATCC 28846 / CBS 209.66 / NRRL 28638) TaxID=796925 RepID=A0A137P9C8_CONC2|nr:hypothetical protein CONCODRAFT_78245 [Conidiobolus coronatus NRRL 28638]|eukprot:KXN71617.1 hypothetical protein CONCODRAFT_78245 [Conidiobolus coronatus NRRL 28638]
MLTSIYFTGLLLSLVNSQCFDPPSVLSRNQALKPVDCENPLPKFQNLKSSSEEKDGGTVNKLSGKSKDSMIQIDLSCTSSNTTCGRVMDTFITASDYLTNIIKFKAPINIQAAFTSFCLNLGECNKINQILGAAQIARYHQLKSDDGKIRLYPQALAKQVSTPPSSAALNPSDIIAEFNSDAKFYFQSQGGQIGKDEMDFLLVVSHELVHGLGFATIYNDHFNEKPQALFPSPEAAVYSDGRAKISNFLESIFDRYVVVKDGKGSLAAITDVFNGYVTDNKDKMFKDENEAIQNFIQSSQYQVAKDLLKTAQVEGSMEFVFDTKIKAPFSSLVLETGLKPYTPSSSLSHVSIKTYADTKDFLMTHEMGSGNSLQKLVSSIGSGNWNTAPYGPGLLAMLETIGYNLKQNPHSNITSDSSDTESSSSNSKPGNKGSNFGQKSINISWALLTSMGLIYYYVL